MSDMLSSAQRVAERLAVVQPRGSPGRVVAVYGGAESHQRSDGSRVVPWEGLASLGAV